MITGICNGSYDTVYTNDMFDNQGIYQCKDTNYVYYINDLKEKESDYYVYGELYELGYTYHEEIEEIFPNSIYLYRKSFIIEVPSELKIAVVANSEDELIDNYAEKFYEFIKSLNTDYQKDIELLIFFNNSLSGIDTTYDKLFLTSRFKLNNVTENTVINGKNVKYIFRLGDPFDLLNIIFIDKNNYPSSARDALKNNRHINLTIRNGRTITFEEFVEVFRNSFDDSL